jgi:DNA-directed RNA polymerase subunit RPC12/RpoP
VSSKSFKTIFQERQIEVIRVSCPDCEKKYKIPEKFLGRKVACKDCGNQFLVQQQKTASSSRVTSSPKSKSKQSPVRSKSIAPSKQTPRKETPRKQTTPENRLPRLGKSKNVMSGGRIKASKKQLKNIVAQLQDLEDFPKPRPSIMHRFTALFVACTMLVLPLVYIAFTAGVGWLTWWHTTHNYVWISYFRGRSVIYIAALYGFMVVAGVLWVFSLIRPIFMRISPEETEEGISREEEPLLYELADSIAEVVGSP